MLFRSMTFLLANESVRLMRDDKGDWLPTDPAMFKPFIKYRVETKQANAALKKYAFKDFQAWVKARHAFNKDNTRRAMRDPKYHTGWRDTEAKYMEGAEQWESLYADYGLRAVELVRDMIYRLEDCITKVEIPAIAGYDVSSINASANKWRRLASQY